MRYEITHSTRYSYRRSVLQSHHRVLLRPRQSPNQRLLRHSLVIEPPAVQSNETTDYFGNTAVLMRIEDAHMTFAVHASSTVDVVPPPVPELGAGQAFECAYTDAAAPPDVLQFTCVSRQTPLTPEIVAFAKLSFPTGRSVLAGAMDLTRRIFTEFSFDATATDVSTPITQVLGSRRGVCQDFAHLSIAALRSLGIPARYVSGYLLTRPPPGQIKLKGTDASHAWISVWSPEAGWIDFDPTNGIIPSGEHITVAYGRDYDDISPISGVLLGGGQQTMTVAVDVATIA